VAGNKNSMMAQISRYSEMAFTIPAGVVVGYFVGRWLDGRFGMHSLYIAGVILGAAAGLIQVVMQLLKDPRDGG
jgi:hypothetical protein